MSGKWNQVLFVLICVLGAFRGAYGQEITPAQGVDLLLRFLPDAVVQMRRATDHEDDHGGYTRDEMTEALTSWIKTEGPGRSAQVSFMGPFWNYLELPFPGESRQLVLLYWCETTGEIWWRLVGRVGSGDFSLLQEGEGWYETTPYDIVEPWLTDLDADGVPELLLCSGERHSMTTLFVFRWQGGRLVRITPRSLADEDGDPYEAGIVVSSMECEDMIHFGCSGIHLEDLDGDGKAEIIVGPVREPEIKRDEEGREIDRTYRSITGTRIFHLVNGVYELWREAAPDDPYPITVPAYGVFHPSTLPLSELSNPSNGKLRVFVSDPAGPATVDDYETGRFKYQETALSFKKRWTNHKQPDTTSANFEWGGCPVKQAARQGQGEWQVNPSDPAVPSPDGATEYHFVGPYLELEISRSAVFPYLLQAATDAFAKEPNRDKYFIEVPLSGKMKSGKLAAVSALVCIKETGPTKPEVQAAPAPTASP
ncbi:MAG: FG-GAP repeat domain-containing protein [Acidobacteriota bacterium]